MLKSKSFLAGAVGAIISLTACTSNQTSQNTWAGPTVMASVSVDDATPGNASAKVIRTAHYEIYTTIPDRPDFLSGMAQLMEGAYGVYRTLAPTVQPTDHPMRCYMFGTRQEWMDFTRLHTGQDSTVYLQISRGGYTIHDWYVAYYLGGDNSTYSVAAHEGWHQFVARHFKGRLPPFLEEGIACMFEDVEWDNGLPRFNLTLNPDRALSLRRVVDANELFPLNELITLTPATSSAARESASRRFMPKAGPSPGFYGTAKTKNIAPRYRNCLPTPPMEPFTIPPVRFGSPIWAGIPTAFAPCWNIIWAKIFPPSKTAIANTFRNLRTKT